MLGVESICMVLQVASRTYCVARNCAPSSRTMSDAVCGAELFDGAQNRKVCGVRKRRKTARRSGMSLARDQTARHMRSLGIEGVKRTKHLKTRRRGPTTVRHPDLVRRDFAATAPNQLWVIDLTFVAT